MITICFLFQSNRKVECLNLEDDDIGPEGAVHIVDMLKENDTLTQIVSVPFFLSIFFKYLNIISSYHTFLKFQVQ